MEHNMSLVREQTPYLLTTSTPTTAHTHGILIPAQNFDLFLKVFILKFSDHITLTLHNIILSV